MRQIHESPHVRQNKRTGGEAVQAESKQQNNA